VAIALSLALRNPALVTGVVAANGDGTPYFGADRSTGSGLSRALLIDPIAAAAVTAVVRHRTMIRDLVVSRCGPGCPVDDAAIDRWRAPFLQSGGVDALVTMVRLPLIGLTDQQEAAVTAPVAVLFSDDDASFDRAAAVATAARLHAHAVTGLPGARHLALLGEPALFASALESELRSLSGS
jgi:pimeloyl-ACP methyl ester carboxylesterase